MSFENGKILRIANLGKVQRPGTQCPEKKFVQNLDFFKE